MREIDYNYGSTGSLNSVISRLDSMSEGTVTLESYQYMGLATVVEKDHPQDGVNLTYLGTANGDAGDVVVGLDRFGRITDQKWTTGTNGASGTVKDEYTYTYDLDGNVLSKSNPLHTAFNENYTYDGLSRLTAVSRNDSTSQTFALNNIGDINSVTTNGTEQDRTTNDQNQITSIGSANPTYDSNGNITKDDHGDTLVYDAWNRLVAVYNASGVLLAGYTYDGYGRMTSETNVTTTTDFYYSGTQDIQERTGVTDDTGASLSSNGTTTLVNVYSPDYVNDILLRDSYASGSFSSRVYFSHDVVYSVTGVISTSGVVLQRQSYSAYGDVTFLSANWVTSSDTYSLENLWQGGWRSQLTDYYHFDARWYSPSLQWLSWDPANYPDGLSGYLPMADNPINRRDPTGRAATAGGIPLVEPLGPPCPHPATVKRSIVNQVTVQNIAAWMGLPFGKYIVPTVVIRYEVDDQYGHPVVGKRVDETVTIGDHEDVWTTSFGSGGANTNANGAVGDSWRTWFSSSDGYVVVNQTLSVGDWTGTWGGVLYAPGMLTFFSQDPANSDPSIMTLHQK